jgi:hypothetical protein
MTSPADIQALIDETEALGWDGPVHLDQLEDSTAARHGFAFIGKLVTLKPPNTHQVRQTLTSVWSFAAPFTMEVLSSTKFLFTVPSEAIYHRILALGPWNIKYSLLLLKPWPPALAIEEVQLHFCPFWVQVHHLPLQYMTVKNALKMAKGIGEFLELDNCFSGDLISRQFIRFKVDVNTSKPLVPGFYISRPGLANHWIAFKYERLDDYCVACGLIGHKKGSCPAPQVLIPPEKYDISLRPSSTNGPKLIAKVHSEDSDSGLSSAASVGNSPCGIGPSHASSSSSQNNSQLVPHVPEILVSHGKDKLTRDHPQSIFSQELAIQHVDPTAMVLDLSDISTSPAHHHPVPVSMLTPQAATSLRRWKKSALVQAVCELHDKEVPRISSISADSSPPYSTLTDPTCYPLLSNYTQRTQSPLLDFSSQGVTDPFLTPLKTNRNTFGFFNQFLSSWAQNNHNPHLFGPPPPFQLNSYPTAAHSPLMQPKQPHVQSTSKPPASPYDTLGHSTRRATFQTHQPSRFMPYSHNQNSPATTPTTSRHLPRKRGKPRYVEDFMVCLKGKIPQIL